ncbi:MAG: hypothetical protein L0226_11600 [Acidobacteria bacterium]|nr:hypothetical protein [Acidobacteriota bacterium]
MKDCPVKIAASLISVFLLPVIIFVCSLTASSLSKSALIQDSQNRIQAQNQQGLSPEKKKSLSNYGPEDVFPGETDEGEARKKSNRSATRPVSAARSSLKPGLQSSKTAPITAQSPAPTKVTAAMTKPTPTAIASVTAQAQQNVLESSTSQQSNTRWLLSSLAVLSLLVLTTFIYVLLKLMEKLREGS